MTNNDIPAAPVLASISLTDKIAIYDVSAIPNGERAITVGQFFQLAINALPTADPTVAGQLYLNAGVLTVSSGA